MIKRMSYLSPKTPIYLVYMLQQVEYSPNPFLVWLKRANYLPSVMHRKTLVWTNKATVLVVFLYVLWIAYLAGFLSLAFTFSPWYLFGLVLVPLLTVVSVYVSVGVAWVLIEKPKRRMEINQSQKIFAAHRGTKIAIAGSYGKTTIKEILKTVLSEGKKVAVTPGNKNVAISHARWAKTLKGDEDVLLIEFGESQPGDVTAFCRNTSPDIGIITGITPNHLDKYKTLQTVSDDIFSLKDYVDAGNLYINSESENVRSGQISLKSYNMFQESGSTDVKISDISISLEGMEFSASINGGRKIHLKTGLVGRHLIGPLALTIELANKLGLNEKQIKEGISKTHPFEHRMQPRNIGGAWVVDDAYNGNLEGMRAGLNLLAEIKAKRKIYVTPGLVDQGEETETVHKQIGKSIAKTKPDKVVLMQNSVTRFIADELATSGFAGEVELRDDPLEYYSNLEHTLAAGDVVMLQNDWTDNYA